VSFLSFGHLFCHHGKLKQIVFTHKPQEIVKEGGFVDPLLGSSSFVVDELIKISERNI